MPPGWIFIRFLTISSCWSRRPRNLRGSPIVSFIFLSISDAFRSCYAARRTERLVGASVVDISNQIWSPYRRSLRIFPTTNNKIRFISGRIGDLRADVICSFRDTRRAGAARYVSIWTGRGEAMRVKMTMTEPKLDEALLLHSRRQHHATLIDP